MNDTVSFVPGKVVVDKETVWSKSSFNVLQAGIR